VTIKPGRPGTKDLTTEYGDRLLCVRYRYDDEQCVRYKTVELIVEEAPWVPSQTLAPTDLVAVHIRSQERALRSAAFLLGARPTDGPDTWRMTYAVARILGLAGRVGRVRRR